MEIVGGRTPCTRKNLQAYVRIETLHPNLPLSLQTRRQRERQKKTRPCRDRHSAPPPPLRTSSNLTTIAPTHLSGTMSARGFHLYVCALTIYQSLSLACEAAATWDNATGSGGGAGTDWSPSSDRRSSASSSFSSSLSQQIPRACRHGSLCTEYSCLPFTGSQLLPGSE
jgi:hypothetical protein